MDSDQVIDLNSTLYAMQIIFYTLLICSESYLGNHVNGKNIALSFVRALPRTLTISENPVTDGNTLMGFKLSMQHTHFIYLFIWPQNKACRILVPGSGIESVHPAVKV